MRPVAAIQDYLSKRRYSQEGEAVATAGAEEEAEMAAGEEPLTATAEEEDSAESIPRESPRDRMVRRKKIVLGTIVLVWFASGYLLFASMELGPIRTFYLMAQIITTVGYGDLVPETQGQKLACTAVVLSSTLLVANIVMAFISDVEDKVGDEVAADMSSMTLNISAYVQAEQTRQAGADDSPTDFLVKPNHLKLKQQEARWKRTRRELVISTGLFTACLVIGVVFFALADGCNTHECESSEDQVKTWVDALYMTVITMTTVGFGDLVPNSRIGKGFSTLWMMAGVAVTVRLLGNVSSAIDQALREDVQTEMTRELFHDSDKNSDGHLDEMEFLQLQFVQNGLASRQQFEEVRAQFKIIAGDDGKISADEYAAFFLPARKSGKMRSSHKGAASELRATPSA